MSNAPSSARAPLTCWLAGLIASASATILLAWFWRGGLPYDSSSGVWATLADDVAHGELYRAVDGPTGYGGTRYMPLFFAVHGALIHARWPVLWSGMFLTLASSVMLLGLTYRLMRAFGATRQIALPATLVTTASISFQLLGLSIKGDFLGAALNLAGLLLVLRGGKLSREWMLRAAGVAFALAILTKFTEVFALGAVVIWLARGKQWRRLTAIVVPAALATATGLTLANWLSGGRMAEAFAVCATGGLKLSYAWRFPYWFVRVSCEDPFFVAIALAGAVLALGRLRRLGWDLPLIYYAVTVIGTLLMFASPGTDSNHVIDLLVASLVITAVECSSGAIPARAMSAAAALLAVAISVTWIPGMPSVYHFLQERGRPTQAGAGVDEIFRRLPDGASTALLSENPIVPLAIGQRPAVLDTFSLRLLSSGSDNVRREFFERLTQKQYAAVVLVDWSGAPKDERWREIERHTSLGVQQFYGEVHFPAGFLSALNAHYRLSFVVSPFVVFEPRTGEGGAP
jgi:hypothetical protein